MKKKLTLPLSTWDKGKRKLFFMRLGLLKLMLIFGMMSTHANVNSQMIISKLKLDDVELAEVLEQVEMLTSYDFVFNYNDLKGYKVSVDVEDETLEDCLFEVLNDVPFQFHTDGDVVVISYQKPIESVKQEKRELKGTVTDEKGLPLPGVSVVEKGTTNGVATDIDGNFVIHIEDNQGAILVFSFVGMLQKEVGLTNSDDYVVVLQDDTETLGEVVCTGYQTLSRERATGSFTQLKSEELAQRPTMSFVDKLDGKTAGVSVKNGKITIRGTSTMRGNSDPLYVVDGFPLAGDPLTVNPEDIESITILKDAAAASIWGVRASNGVVVITTKKGKLSEKTKIEFSSSLAIDEKVDFDKMNWLSPAQEIDMDLEYMDKGWINWGSEIPAGFAFSSIQEAYIYKLGLAPDGRRMSESTFNAYVDQLKQQDAAKQWEKHLFRNAVKQTYNISLSGGGEKNQLYASLVYNDNKQNAVGNSNNRVMLNIQDRFFVNDKLSVFLGVNTTLRKQKLNGVNATHMKSEDATNDLYDAHGRKIQYYRSFSKWKSKERESLPGGLPYTYNQLEEVENTDNTISNMDVRAQFGLNYKVIKGLEIESKFQYEKGFSDRDKFSSMNLPSQRMRVNDFYTEIDGELTHQIPLGTEYRYSKGNSYSWVWRNTISYNKEWEKHQLNLFAGGEVKKAYSERIWDTRFGYNKQTRTSTPVDRKKFISGINHWKGWKEKQNLYGVYNDDLREVSTFGNLAYTYDHKYSFTGSFRVDQKNLFGSDPDFRYKPLWSVGAGWQLGNEGFMSGIDWINRLNLRATYGITGNASNEFSPYPKAVNVVSGFGSNFYDYLNLASPANDNLKWEETAVTNFAVDFAFFNSKLHGSVEYYYKNSTDLLAFRAIDSTNGSSYAPMNFASMKNKGVELMLNFRVLETKDFRWDVNVNLSYNQNEVSRVNNEISAPDQNVKYGAEKRGLPLHNLYSYNYAGLSEHGDVMLYDLDGNKKSWREGVDSSEELLYHGTSVAPYYGGLSTTLAYKGFDLTLNTTFKAGYKFKYHYGVGSDARWNRMNKAWANRWQKPGDELTTRIPKLAYEGINPTTGELENKWDSTTADLYWKNSQDMIHSGTFIKAKEIILGYTMPQNILKSTPVNSLRMSVQVNNPFMWVKNKEGVDPENAYRAGWTNLKGVIFGLKASF